MPNIVEFHFLLLAAGEVLKVKKSINALDIQSFIQNDDTFGVRPPLPDCRLALNLLESSGFIKKMEGWLEEYERA